jgi:hypothetical protein
MVNGSQVIVAGEEIQRWTRHCSEASNLAKIPSFSQTTP